jgi:hypothetical protein
LEQATTLSPGVWANCASGDSLWCSTAPMPPPNGMRITIGTGVLPCERKHSLATWHTIWS